MGINRLTIEGYGQIELNRVSFPITGRVISDLGLNTAFNTATPAENGMILVADFVAGEVKLPTGPSGDGIYALHYSPEKEYDPNLLGLNKFKLVANNAVSPFQARAQGYAPRMGILSVGEKFTTNTLCYNTAVFANNAVALAALVNCATTPVYGVPHLSGAIELVATLGTPDVGLQAIAKTTMPDGDVGVKFVVIKAQ